MYISTQRAAQLIDNLFTGLLKMTIYQTSRHLSPLFCCLDTRRIDPGHNSRVGESNLDNLRERVVISRIFSLLCVLVLRYQIFVVTFFEFPRYCCKEWQLKLTIRQELLITYKYNTLKSLNCKTLSAYILLIFKFAYMGKLSHDFRPTNPIG